MQNFHCAIGLILGFLSFSCDGKKPAEVRTSSGYSTENNGDYTTQDFSAWMSKGDMQFAYEKRKPGTFFIYVEGRNHGGFHQYRFVSRPFPKEKFSEWSSFWGMTSEAFYQLDIKMLRAGFERSNLQVFEDATGQAFYQSLWMKPTRSVLVTPRLQQPVNDR
ncbi:MAG: hypothetical protein RLZZ282_915 [Verrucomicrobiota bacterium]|jgi:hypothetical protein